MVCKCVCLCVCVCSEMTIRQGRQNMFCRALLWSSICIDNWLNRGDTVLRPGQPSPRPPPPTTPRGLSWECGGQKAV